MNFYKNTLPDSIFVNNNTPFYSDWNFWLTMAIIAVAITAIVIPYVINRKNENSRLLRLENYIYYLFDYVLNAMDKIITGKTKLMEEVKDKEQRDYSFRIGEIIAVKNYQKLSQDDIYRIFMDMKKRDEEEKIKHYNNLNDAIESLMEIEERDKLNYMSYLNDLRRYESNFKESLNKIFRQYEIYLGDNLRNELDVENDKFLKGFKNILKDWRESNDQSYENTLYRLVNPLKTHCVQYIDDELNRANIVLENVIVLIDANEEIDAINKSYSDAIKNEIAKLNERRNNIKNAVDFFRE